MQDESTSRAQAVQPVTPDMIASLARRLEKAFGLGDQPTKRREFYEFVQSICTEYGDHPYRLVVAMARDAGAAIKPDRFFCVAVVKRLRRAGYFSD